MAEPLSIVASAVGFVGLADVVLRAGKELYATFGALKEAPREVKALNSELTDLNDVLTDIQAFSLEHDRSPFSFKDGLKLERLIAALKMTQADITFMRNTIHPIKFNASHGTVKQLRNRFQWARMKDKLEYFREELNKHKFTLLTTLFMCGGRNDIQIRKNQHTIEQSLLGLQTSTARQYHTLVTTLQEGSQSSKEALRAIKGLEISNKQGLETVQASISAQMRTLTTNTQLISQDNFEVQQQTVKVNNSATVAREQTNQSLGQVVAPASVMSIGGREENDWHSQLIDLDVESLVMSVLLTKETLRDTLCVMFYDEETGNPASEITEMIWSEINKLLASSFEASASLADRRSRFPFARAYSSPQAQASHYYPSALTPEESSLRNSPLDARNGQRLASRPFKRTRRTKYHLQMTPNGLLSIEMNCGAADDGEHMTSARVTFIPTIKSCRVGFEARLSRSVQNAPYPTINRELSIVNVIPNEEILLGAWGTGPRNDIIALQSPLSESTVTPFDHLDNGTTVLWVCPRKFWHRTQRMINRSSVGSQFFQSSPDVITARCGSEVLSMVLGHCGSSKTGNPTQGSQWSTSNHSTNSLDWFSEPVREPVQGFGK